MPALIVIRASHNEMIGGRDRQEPILCSKIEISKNCPKPKLLPEI